MICIKLVFGIELVTAKSSVLSRCGEYNLLNKKKKQLLFCDGIVIIVLLLLIKDLELDNALAIGYNTF